MVPGFSHQRVGMLIKFFFRWYIIYYNYSKEKCCFSFDVNFSVKDILIAFIFCSNVLLITIFHDSKFELGCQHMSDRHCSIAEKFGGEIVWWISNDLPTINPTLSEIL